MNCLYSITSYSHLLPQLRLERVVRTAHEARALTQPSSSAARFVPATDSLDDAVRRVAERTSIHVSEAACLRAVEPWRRSAGLGLDPRCDFREADRRVQPGRMRPTCAEEPHFRSRGATRDQSEPFPRR
jgi:hypothetical protein